MGDSRPPRVRKDWARNRAALLRAAQEVMAMEGLAAPAERVAADAGVSIATLYRHFPDRESLVAEVQRGLFDEWNALLVEAGTQPRAWDGLVWLFRQLGDRAAAHPHFAELSRQLMARGYPGSTRWTTAWSALISRAHEQGDLRADLGAADISVTMIGFVMVVSAFEPLEPGMRHRHLEVLFTLLRDGA